MPAGLTPCSSEEIAAQLSRILSTDVFRRSPSLGRFLKYLVDRAAAGEQESVKEYRLGLEVFDRGDDFDPRDDTIVRVQARNLRGRLDEYYANRTDVDTIRFVLPKGAYAIHFQPIEIPPDISLESAPPLAAGAEVQSRSPTMVIAAAILVIAGAAATFGFLAMKSSAKSPSKSVPGEVTLLVAPFANLSSEEDNEYFAGGLTEELTDALANLPGLRVVARTTSARWKDKDLDLGNLRQLGIEDVVEGSIRKEGRNVRIAVRLIDASNGRHLWAQEYDREIQDSILTEREIANAIVTRLKLSFAATLPLPSARPRSPEAYDLYLKGLYSWKKFDGASAERGIAYLERSVSLDPSFAPAYVALAGCYGVEVAYYRIPAIEGWAKDREMALKALQLDDTLAEAHTLLGGVYAWNDQNWERSELEYRRGVQLGPQSVIAHQYFASFLGALGRQTEAEALMREAIHLDPLDSLLQWGEAQLIFWRGDYRQAESVLTQIVKRDPDFGMTAKLLAEVEWALGQDHEAETVLRAHLAHHPLDPVPLGELGYTLGKLGRAGEARDILNQLEEQARHSVVPPQAFAFVYQGLGNDRRAMDELWKASDARSMRVPWLRVEPVYAPLKQDPRWADLLRHGNLSQQ
jgi:TolB-like protein/Tfp pilus assembly protein PilF